jgi:hypothetical protein
VNGLRVRAAGAEEIVRPGWGGREPQAALHVARLEPHISTTTGRGCAPSPLAHRGELRGARAQVGAYASGWGPPKPWNWSAVQRHTRRLQRVLKQVA